MPKPAVLKELAARSLPLLVVVATAVSLFVYNQQVLQFRQQAFEPLVLKKQERARTQLKRLFEPVATTLSILARWIEAETPDLGDAPALNTRFIPILEEMDQMSAALLANTDGREYMLMRKEGAWLTRRIAAGSPDAQAFWDRWADAVRSVESWKEGLAYDPRQRPWFRGAVDSLSPDAVFWTRPYRFFTSGEPGITAARRCTPANREGDYLVVAFDVLLSDVSALSMGLTTGDGDRAFILTGDGRVAGVPADPQFETASTVAASALKPAETFPVAMVRDAYAQWLAQGRPADAPFVFDSDDQTWWASFWHYPLGNQSLWLAVTVPEADLARRLGQTGHAMAAIIVVGGLLLFLASILVSRKYIGRVGGQGASAAERTPWPGGADGREGDPQDQLRAMIADGENEGLEFKSSVRWNFKAGRTGKEIELAWLKTVAAFMNSKGGLILIGVDDSGEILGLGKDGFANDDMVLRHIENLIARHLGATCFPYIRSRLIRVDDKQVLAIACDTAPKPVFLKHDKGEEFYIRTGPASRSLAPSEVVGYLETRNHRSR